MAFVERREPRLVDEDLQIAGVGEIDLRRKEGDAVDAIVAGRGHIGERQREQRAADAIARRRHLAFARRLLDHVERGQHALVHIGLEPLRRPWLSSGLTQEMMKTVKPCSTAQRTKLFSGLRSST